MSKVLITTFTGLLAIGGATAALAQPKPVIVSKDDVRVIQAGPVKVAQQIDVQELELRAREMAVLAQEGAFKWQPGELGLEAIEKAQKAIEKNQEAFEKLDKLKDKFDAKSFDFKPGFEWDGPKMKPGALADLANDLHAMRLGQESPVIKIARRFEECDRSRGKDDDAGEGHFYNCGQRAMDENQWDRAADYFGRAAAAKGTRADGALYWKAYAQNRLGQRAEALNTIAELKNTYRQGRWLTDANMLEVEVRQKTSAPVSPTEAADDEIKIIAVNALGDSPDAVPILEKLLTGPQSPKLKDRALFVLAQNQTPQARAVLVKIAKGGANPELQLRAVRYLGQIGSSENREILSQVYASSPDVQVKKQIIRSYMEANDRAKLLTVARGETDQSLRMEAVRRLGDMGAGAELAELYAKETSAEVKKTILRGLGNSRQTDRVLVLAQSETDPELKRTAIRLLGLNRSAETGAQIVSIYQKDQNRDVREAAIEALFLQNNATALIQLARQEKDPELKRRIISKLAVMRSDEAKQFFLEILK